jgi:thiol-disulfide isomerase/thioredoxin
MRAAAVILACALGACLIAPPPPAFPQASAPARSVLADLLAAPDLDGRADPAGAAPGAQPQATVVIVFASWCTHCHDEIAVLDQLRIEHPALRVLGVNYRGHEEYDARGSSQQVRNYVRNFAPWMRVVPVGEDLFGELGRPPKVPTLYVYDARGALVATYDRQLRDQPDRAELEALLARIGA